jgi:quercetin dioxygenase-like cupin family protein
VSEPDATSAGTLHVAADEGKALWVVDELMTFKAVGEDTGGAYALTDSLVPPQGGPPPHIQHREDKAFWVLQGELEFLIDGGTIRARGLSSTFLKALHTFKNVGSTPARFLTLLVSAGLERYFEEVGKPGTDFSSPPPIEQEDIDRLLAAAPKYGVEIKPPPEP